jgi:hypothetical protein
LERLSIAAKGRDRVAIAMAFEPSFVFDGASFRFTRETGIRFFHFVQCAPGARGEHGGGLAVAGGPRSPFPASFSFPFHACNIAGKKCDVDNAIGLFRAQSMQTDRSNACDI